MPKSRFALFFGSRGFFPASLIAGAREELQRELEALGHQVILLDAEATRYGAVETAREGEVYANFLRENRGRFDGVILCLPNFGDENGAVAALKDAGVPIFIQAYPDDYDQMGPATRRDSFCGKISIMDVFRQWGVKYTVFKPHTVRPGTPRFAANIDQFDRVCQVVKGVRGMTIGAIGARTTPFKTVRVDELALQRHGISIETFDLADIFLRMRDVKVGSAVYQDKAHALQAAASWTGVPEQAFDNLVRLGVALDAVAAEARLDAMAIRCWTELQMQFGVSPCVVMGVLAEGGLSAACEVDLGNAVTMHALQLAAYQPSGLLDWNNNYFDEEDKCILFHCGPLAPGLMESRGRIADHAILKNSVGEGHSYGCNVGRIKPVEFTFGSLMTDSGAVKVYLGEGRFTADPIPENFFGVAGVAEIERLQEVLLFIGQNGHRHHVSFAPGRVQDAVKEALGNYLEFDVALPQK